MDNAPGSWPRLARIGLAFLFGVLLSFTIVSVREGDLVRSIAFAAVVLAEALWAYENRDWLDV